MMGAYPFHWPSWMSGGDPNQYTTVTWTDNVTSPLQQPYPYHIQLVPQEPMEPDDAMRQWIYSPTPEDLQNAVRWEPMSGYEADSVPACATPLPEPWLPVSAWKAALVVLAIWVAWAVSLCG